MQLFETYADTEYICLAHPPHHWAWSHQSAPYDKKCNGFLRMIKNCSVDPQMLRTTNKKYAKKSQKYANNPQKYAKTRKNKQFAISTLFVLNMDLIRHSSCFSGLTNQSSQCTIRATQGANKRLILQTRLGDTSMIRLALDFTCMLNCINHCNLYDAMINDMTCLSQVQ